MIDALPDLTPAQEKLLHQLASQDPNVGQAVVHFSVEELSEIGHLAILQLVRTEGHPPRLKITERGMRIAYLRSIT